MATERDHRLQQQASWCVPACVEIVLARRGDAWSQAQAAGDWHAVGHGYSIEDAATHLELEVTRLDPLAPLNYDWLELQLVAGAWIIAYVFVAPLNGAHLAHALTPRSPHGPLDGNRHTIVLCDFVDGEYRYLDPFFAGDGQPSPLSREEFVEAFQGHVIVVPR